MTNTEGIVSFDVPAAGKPCQTWYKIVGDLRCGITPLVVVHGGPGLTHHCMLPLGDLWESFGIPVILYDQLGNGGSTHLPEKKGDETFWIDSLFHAELVNLTRSLNLYTYDLLGISWGGSISSTFASTRPLGLRKLVLSNAPASEDAAMAALAAYRRELLQETQDTLQRHEDTGTEKSQEYEDAMMVVMGRHMCTVNPVPEDLLTSLEWAEKDDTVSLTMNGSSEWVTHGSLRHWTSIPMIKNINMPTLVINGMNEVANDEAIKPFLEMIPDVRWIKMMDSTHTPQWEERENYIRVVGEWLTSK